jgi:DNA repair exonuclease SbcCD ATPase subunit
LTLSFGSEEADQILKNDRLREFRAERLAEIAEELSRLKESHDENEDELQHLRDLNYGITRQMTSLKQERQKLNTFKAPSND